MLKIGMLYHMNNTFQNTTFVDVPLIQKTKNLPLNLHELELPKTNLVTSFLNLEYSKLSERLNSNFYMNI